MPAETGHILANLFSELVDGAKAGGGAFILNSGDVGMLSSLDKLSADDASRSVNDGATIAAHAQHIRYGLSLMNRWAMGDGDPFADAKWDEAWKTSGVNTGQWDEIRSGLRDEAHRNYGGTTFANRVESAMRMESRLACARSASRRSLSRLS